jgi:hypothetical protein
MSNNPIANTEITNYETNESTESVPLVFDPYVISNTPRLGTMPRYNQNYLPNIPETPRPFNLSTPSNISTISASRTPMFSDNIYVNGTNRYIPTTFSNFPKPTNNTTPIIPSCTETTISSK